MSEMEDIISESLEQETMRSLATDMQTVKMHGFKYNQSIADVMSIKDSLLANYNKVNQEGKKDEHGNVIQHDFEKLGEDLNQRLEDAGPDNRVNPADEIAE